MEKRGSGILLHITSLPSPYGIGDLGPDARGFVDFLAKTGQSYWQILPLNLTCPAYGNSPYSSFSAFAGNLFLISPELMAKEGLLKRSRSRDLPRFPQRGSITKKLLLTRTVSSIWLSKGRQENFTVTKSSGRFAGRTLTGSMTSPSLSQ